MATTNLGQALLIVTLGYVISVGVATAIIDNLRGWLRGL